MILTAKDVQFAIVDETLDSDSFKNFWNYFGQLDFVYRSMTGWQKFWKINDGQILSSASYNSTNLEAPLNAIHQGVSALAEQHLESIVGKKGEAWNEIVYTPFIYPVGSKTSWNNNYDCAASCIFYVHQEWNPHWGGELFIAKTPPKEEIVTTTPNSITREYVSPLLDSYGMGIYISPLPNRMVFLKGSVWNFMNRIDQSAGDKVHCSIVAHFLKK